MAGGLLQLAAYGTQDLYMTGNPEITFFKTIYRRHTNFSTNFHNVNLTSPLDFGTNGMVRMPRFGDLLHRVFLVMELPEIDLVFRSLTVGEVKSLLSNFDITWKTSKSDSSIFVQEDYDQVSLLISNREGELENENIVFDQMLEKLQNGGMFYPPTWLAENPGLDDTPNPGGSEAAKKYLQDIINDFFQYDKYNCQYRFIDAQNKDIVNRLKLLANSIVIQSSMFKIFVADAVSFDNDPSTYNDDNIEFYLNTDIANYVFQGGLNQADAATIFRAGIANIYGSRPYSHLDAFKIFNIMLDTLVVPVEGPSDIQNVKTLLLDNIRAGLVKNIQLMIGIYNTLNPDIDQGARFTFFRKLPVSSGTFITTTTYSTYSLIPSPPDELNDRFGDKLVLPIVPGEDNIVHQFSLFANNRAQQYYTDNRDAFRLSLFTSYFNELSLWIRTDIGTSPYTPTLSRPLPRNYYLNYIWYLMNHDIPYSAETYMTKNPVFITLGFSPANITSLVTELKALEPIIKGDIDDFIILPDNFVMIDKLDQVTKTVTGPQGDIVMSAIFRPGYYLTFDGQKMLVHDYIAENYLKVINNFDAGGQQALYDSSVKSKLVDVVNLYRTPLIEIPDYTAYVSRNRNLYAPVVRRINNIGGSNIVYSDAISSIVNYAFSQFVQNTDNLYNNSLLGFKTYEDSIGAELLNYLDSIARTSFGYTYDPDNYVPFEYYIKSDEYRAKLPENAGEIGVYLVDRLDALLAAYSKYFNNRGLLDMRNIIISRVQTYFAEFNKVVDLLTGIIESQPVRYQHQNHGTPDDVVLRTKNFLINNPDPTTRASNNAMDIANEMRNLFNTFSLSAGFMADPVNPYSPITDPNKNSLWEEKKNTFNKIDQINLFNQLFAFLYPTPQNPNAGAPALYNFLTLIDVKYNGFSLESDFYNFILDFVVQESLLKDFPALQGNTVADTNSKIISYLDARIAQNKKDLEGLAGLDVILQRSLNAGEQARFAWIEKLGHYLIDFIRIKIGDQVFDEHPGEWLEIWHQVSKRTKKERGYKELIGDVPELTVFSRNKKGRYELVVPLQFWFNKYPGLSVPMIGLLHTDVMMEIKLKTLDEVSYRDTFTQFVRKPKLKCHLLAEYVYVDSEERDRLGTKKLEYLIPTLQYAGDHLVTKDDFDVAGNEDDDDNKESNVIEHKVFFRNPIISLYWVLQNQKFVDGSNTITVDENGQAVIVSNIRNYGNYAFDSEGRINPAYAAKIKMSSRDREEYKDIIFFEQAMPYERHQSSPSTGINMYGFSLNPESADQPMGSANFSRIDDATVVAKIRKPVADSMRNDGTVFRWGIYGLGYNVMRVVSGLSGLLFNQ